MEVSPPIGNKRSKNDYDNLVFQAKREQHHGKGKKIQGQNLCARWNERKRYKLLGNVCSSGAMDGVRIMLTLAAIENLRTKSIDFVLAYAQAHLDVDIYMELPQGFNVGPESGRYVLKLQKNLYGLKQAGHNWFKKISGALGNLSINPRKVDPCVFIVEDVIVLVYVDNCLIFSRDKDKINQLIDLLNYISGSSRPDIAYATHSEARFLSNPKALHDKGVKRIINYLKGTKENGLIIYPWVG